MSASRIVALVLATATVLVVASLADRSSAAVLAGGVAGRLPAALLVNAGAAAVALAEGAVTRSGALAGGIVGTLIYLGAGWEGWTVLMATFAAAVIASRIGWDRKAALGIAQEGEGRRGAGNAIANCGVAAAAAVVAITSPYQADAWLAVVASLAASGADTVASEIGKARGRRTFLIVGLAPVAPGTPGGISLAGSLANTAAAFALAAIGAAVGLIAARAIPIVAGAALLGSIVESMLGATLEPAGFVDNDVLNFINSAVAAGAALYLI